MSGLSDILFCYKSKNTPKTVFKCVLYLFLIFLLKFTHLF